MDAEIISECLPLAPKSSFELNDSSKKLTQVELAYSLISSLCDHYDY